MRTLYRNQFEAGTIIKDHHDQSCICVLQVDRSIRVLGPRFLWMESAVLSDKSEETIFFIGPLGFLHAEHLNGNNYWIILNA